MENNVLNSERKVKLGAWQLNCAKQSKKATHTDKIFQNPSTFDWWTANGSSPNKHVTHSRKKDTSTPKPTLPVFGVSPPGYCSNSGEDQLLPLWRGSTFHNTIMDPNSISDLKIMLKTSFFATSCGVKAPSWLWNRLLLRGATW